MVILFQIQYEYTNCVVIFLVIITFSHNYSHVYRHVLIILTVVIKMVVTKATYDYMIMFGHLSQNVLIIKTTFWCCESPLWEFMSIPRFGDQNLSKLGVFDTIGKVMKNTNLKWVVFSIYKVEIQIMAK